MIKLTSSQILAFFARQCCKGSEGLTVSPNSQSKIEKNNGYVFNKKKDLDGCTSQLCYCRLYPGACSARQQVNECLDSCCRRHHLPPMLKNHHQHLSQAVLDDLTALKRYILDAHSEVGHRSFPHIFPRLATTAPETFQGISPLNPPCSSPLP